VTSDPYPISAKTHEWDQEHWLQMITAEKRKAETRSEENKIGQPAEFALVTGHASGTVSIISACPAQSKRGGERHAADD